MQILNYFFASLASFLGLLIGSILIRIAPEEQKQLEKYFVLINKILLLLAFALLMFYYSVNQIYIILLFALFASLLLVEHKIKDLSKKSITIYMVLGVLFYLSSKNTNLLATESSIVLLYGIATASIEFSKKKPYKTLFYGIGFIVISNLLLLLTIYRF